MNIAIALAITVVAGGMSPALAASAGPSETVIHHHHHSYRHHYRRPPAAAQPAQRIEAPSLKPYPRSEGNPDGLSRDPDDCAKGCIGGNPM
jgi:hypothetical protein